MPTTTTETAAKTGQSRAAAQAAKPAPGASKPAKPATAKPELSVTAKRVAVFAAANRALCDLLDKWNDPNVSKEEARAIIAGRASYNVTGADNLSATWDRRLGPVATGRGTFAAK